MNPALRQRFRELANAVPRHTAASRDQVWRNIATELEHQRGRAAHRRNTGLRTFSLIGVVSLAVLLVVLLPLINFSPTGYLLKGQLLEAAPRSDKVVTGDWRENVAPDLHGFRRIASNPRQELLLHEDGMQVVVRHKSSGQMWSTSPDVRDIRVPTNLLGRLNSPFAIRYGDEKGRVDTWANPADDMTLLEYHAMSSGVGLRFIFEPIGIAVRINYRLGEDYLEVSIPEDGIEQYGSYHVKAVELFPFFDMVGYPEAKQLVASRAASFDSYQAVAQLVQEKRSPLLFGVYNERAGFLAEVMAGGDTASINIDPTGRMVASERVYVSFAMDSESREKSIGPGREYVVKYHTLTEDAMEADGIAELLQQHMRETLGTGLRIIQNNRLFPFS